MNQGGLTDEQVEALVKYIRSGKYGSYRFLVYDVLDIGYSDGLCMGLLDLNNWLIANKGRSAQPKQESTQADVDERGLMGR